MQLLFIYTITVITIVYISLLVNAGYEKQLKSVDNKIHGLEYISKLYNLNVSVAKCLEIQTLHQQKKNLQKTIIAKNIHEIYEVQKKYPQFINETFNKYLEKLQRAKLTKPEIFNFIDTLNKENYSIGNITGIHFQKDRELYFLGTLIIHYIPEYLVSTLLLHGILENYLTNGYISNKDKNTYIEQNKLIDLSLKELSSIIKLLPVQTGTSTLQSTLEEIKKLKQNHKNIFSSRDVLLKYIMRTHTILDLSYALYDENFNLMKNTLQNKKALIEDKLYKNKIIFSILLFTFSLLVFLYYRLKSSSIVKDKKIQDMTEILDEFVIFSKSDKNGKITYASSALEAISGYSQKELIGSNYRIFKNEEMDSNIYKELWQTILSKKVFHGKLLNKNRDGHPYWVQETITPKVDKDGNIIGFNVYMVDITAKINLEQAHEKLQELSIHDPLTQIYNRLKLDTILQTQYQSYKRHAKVFSVILIDIDYFKEVNDKYGHLVGDSVLKEMATLIQENLRESDFFGRWGGEEFLIISEFTVNSNAYILAEKIRKLVLDFDFTHVGKKTISLGVSQIDKRLTINDLLQEADSALYKAKNSGRNRTVVYQK